MHVGLKIGLGAGAVAATGAAAFMAARAIAGSDSAARVRSDAPGTDTSLGDEQMQVPVRGTIDPPGWWNTQKVEGNLRGSQLDAKIDPWGWGNDTRLSGRVDYGGFDTQVDPRGWGNTTHVSGTRSNDGFSGTVDRPGVWNDVRHSITETVRGAQITREGRFDERLVPRFSEAVWRSTPVGTGGDGRVLEFDPPGWSNTTRVTLEGNVPAGVEATIAAHLFDQWKTEQERLADYPDPSYPDPTGPGDDYPTSPGDDW